MILLFNLLNLLFMKRFIFLFQSILVVTLLCFTACSNEEVVPQEGEVKPEPQEFLNITYKGNVFQNVPIAYDENGDFIFLDEEFSQIYSQELKDNTELSIFVKDSSSIILYENLQTAFDSEGITLIKEIPTTRIESNGDMTRAGYDDLATVVLYDDRDFKDRNLTFALTESEKSVEVTNLKDVNGFNDKCSSLVLTNNLPNDPNQTLKLGSFEYPCTNIDAVFIGYDDHGFSDRTITCIAAAAEVKRYSSLPGFNDKMSSFKFFFAQKGQYQPSF